MRRLMFLLLLAAPLGATLVPRMSFDQLVDESDEIVEGVVLTSWAAWDSGRASIWTHYRIRVGSSLKGAPSETIVISEPGGDVDGVHVEVLGAPRYRVGEEVVVFAVRTPIGYLRTCGWGQGKYRVVETPGGSANRRVERSLNGVVLVDAPHAQAGPVIERMDLDKFRRRIREKLARPAAENELSDSAVARH